MSERKCKCGHTVGQHSYDHGDGPLKPDCNECVCKAFDEDESHPPAESQQSGKQASEQWYVKKRIPIRAVQWLALGDHPAVKMVPSNHPSWNCPEQAARCGWIETLEGGHFVCPGNWIITGVKGEHYAIQDDIFRDTYEAVDSSPKQPASDNWSGNGWPDWPSDLRKVTLDPNILKAARDYCSETARPEGELPEWLAYFGERIASHVTASLRAERDQLEEKNWSLTTWLAECDCAFGGIRSMFRNALNLYDAGKLGKLRQLISGILDDFPDLDAEKAKTWQERAEAAERERDQLNTQLGWVQQQLADAIINQGCRRGRASDY